MEIVDCLINHLREEGTLEQWAEKARSDDFETFESDIFNHFDDLHLGRDFDFISGVAHEIFMHGLHCVCFETLRDKLIK